MVQYTGLVPSLNFRQLYSEPKADFNQPDIIDSYKKMKDDEINRQSKQYLNATTKAKLDSEVQENSVRTLSLIAIQIKPYLQGYDQINAPAMPEDKKATVRSILTSSKAKVKDQNLVAEIDQALQLLENNNIAALSAEIEQLEGLARSFNINSSNKIANISSAAVPSALPALGQMKADGSTITQQDIAQGNWSGRTQTNSLTGETSVVWIAPTDKVREAGAVEQAKNNPLLARKQGESNIDYNNRVRTLGAEETDKINRYTPGGSESLESAQTINEASQTGEIKAQGDAKGKASGVLIEDQQGLIENGRAAESAKTTLERAKAILERLDQEIIAGGGAFDRAATVVGGFLGRDNLDYKTFVTLANNSVLDAVSKTKGASSDRDMNILANTTISASNEPKENLSIINEALPALNRVIQKGQEAQNKLSKIVSTPLPSSVVSSSPTVSTRRIIKLGDL